MARPRIRVLGLGILFGQQAPPVYVLQHSARVIRQLD
jgi:hypothetical protein